MLCPTCHESNPDTNRFCGHCGASLAAQPTPRRRRGDELPQELIEFDKKIPLIAEPGTDRRNNVPNNIREKVQEVLERDRAREAEREREAEALRQSREREIALKAERDAELQRQREIEIARMEREREATRQRELEAQRIEREREIAAEREREIAAERERERDRFRVTVPADEEERPVQLPSGFLGLNTVETPREVEREVAVSRNRIEEEPRVTRTSNGTYWNLKNESRPAPTGVVGPSFLGLSDALEDVEQDEPISHTRRNIALVVLLLLIGLGATQWKAIRDQGLPFVKNGTQRVMLRVKGKQQPTPATTDSTTTANNTGGPSMEVGPLNENLKKQQEALKDQTNADPSATNNAAANNNAAPAPSQNTPTQSASDSNTSTPSEAASVGNTAAANAAATPATTGGAVGAAIPEGSTQAADDAASTETSKPVSNSTEKPTTTVRNRRKPSAVDRPQITDEPSQAGSAEYERALATSDPGLQRTLLWQAVKKGNSDASIKLAELYIAGRGVEKSCDQAMVLLRSASAHSSARARGKLGAMYATGECVQQDRVQAYHWMSMALQANPNSDWTARYRDNLWNQMTAAEKMRAGRDR